MPEWKVQGFLRPNWSKPGARLRGEEDVPFEAAGQTSCYTPVMSRLRRLVRTTGALLVLLGLGTSMLEGIGCTGDQNDVVQVRSFPTDGSGDGNNPEAPRPNTSHCCPCIHSYPGTFKVAIVLVPPLVDFSTTFALDSRAGPDHRPQPLVRPPIV